MVQSMTAFARGSGQYDWGTIALEIRTVNHRYLELSIRMPEVFRELEEAVREMVARYIKRGKVDFQLKYQLAPEAQGLLTVDEALVKQLHGASCSLKKIWGDIPAPDSIALLMWPGVLQTAEIDKKPLAHALLAVTEKTLKAVMNTRKTEGAAILQFQQERLMKMTSLIDEIKQRIPNVLASQRVKILARFGELNAAINQDRLEQELLLLIQKMDVTEEIERLQTHIIEITQLLQSNEAVGRKLDFFMQELNREANTLGSKSIDAKTSHLVVELKVLIEQMREQIQNIE